MDLIFYSLVPRECNMDEDELHLLCSVGQWLHKVQNSRAGAFCDVAAALGDSS